MTDIWTTAYLAGLASPEDTLPFIPPSRAFTAQTVRQAVRLGRGGTSVRLVLSNEFGHAPLVIDEVAVSDNDARAVLPALHHGGARWEIPAGQTATSDPVPLTIGAGEELQVSCYLSGNTEPATFLHSAQRTGEVAPGNQLGQHQLTDPERFTSLYWIAKILTDAPANGPVIVAFGDSITRGDRTADDRDQRYPDHLQRRLHAAGADGAVVLNAGIGGNRLLRPRVGPSMTDRFDRDVLGVAETTHVVIMAGINDVALSAVLGQQRPTAGDIADGLLELAHRAQQHGIQPILGTTTPFAFASRPSDSPVAKDNEDIRQAINHALTTQKDWPTADFAASLAAPDDPARLAPAYDSGDGFHPADAGANALANAVDLAMFA
jgi:lysophospholipase L1-like esterase